MSHPINELAPLPKDAITMQQAKAWTKEYQDAHKGETKAYLIPNIDLINILVELGVLIDKGAGNYHYDVNADGVSALRAYLGTDLTEKGDDQNKMVLCGAVDVLSEYQDQVKGTPNTLQVKLAGEGVFDLIKPCPSFCDKNSPLMHK